MAASPREGLDAALRSARSGADLGVLALAMQRGDSALALTAVDWQALVAKLLLIYEPAEAVSIVTETQRGFEAAFQRLLISGAQLTADQLIAVLGINAAQAEGLAGRLAALATIGIAPQRLAAVVAEQADSLVASRTFALASDLAPAADVRAFHAIDRIEETYQAPLADAFATVIELGQKGIDLAVLTAAVAARDLAAVKAAIPAEEMAIAMRSAVDQLLAAAHQAGAIAGIEGVGGLAAGASSEVSSTWAGIQAGKLGTWIRDSATASATETLGSVEAFSAPAGEVATLIRDRLGIAPRDAAAAANRYADVLDGGGSAEEATQAARLYVQDLEAIRRKLFGSDQAYAAANEGQRAGWVQARDSGLIRDVSRYWLTREDGRVCSICAPMQGQQRRLDEPFYSPPERGGNGRYYMNPADPHEWCRCAALVLALKVA